MQGRGIEVAESGSIEYEDASGARKVGENSMEMVMEKWERAQGAGRKL